MFISNGSQGKISKLAYLENESLLLDGIEVITFLLCKNQKKYGTSEHNFNHFQ